MIGHIICWSHACEAEFIVGNSVLLSDLSLFEFFLVFLDGGFSLSIDRVVAAASNNLRARLEPKRCCRVNGFLPLASQP